MQINSFTAIHTICDGRAFTTRSLESDINIIGKHKVKLLIRSSFLVLSITELAACTIGNGHICGPQTPVIYCDKEAYEKLMNTKGYGEYWEKPNMTKESWRQDWVTCGGMSNGNYASEAPSGSTTEVFLADSKRISQRLAACMQSKGYEYHYTGVGATPKTNEH